jgi:L-methionine (R)-S-oxide reductase
MATTVTREQLVTDLRTMAQSAPTVEDLMTDIVGRLQQYVPHYNWVGFYMIEKSAKPDVAPVLVLGPYVGAPTSHTRIPLNEGICGAAVTTGDTVVVDDVQSDPRYLACSIETKSEIVVPVRVRGEIVGELDIDSHEPVAFTPDDRTFCEFCARLVGEYLERTTTG